MKQNVTKINSLTLTKKKQKKKQSNTPSYNTKKIRNEIGKEAGREHDYFQSLKYTQYDWQAVIILQ